MDEKKRQKFIENAELKFQKEQLQAAAAVEQLDTAIATIELFQNELTPEALADVEAKIAEQKAEIEKFLTNARDKYVAKLKELGDPKINLETGELA